MGKYGVTFLSIFLILTHILILYMQSVFENSLMQHHVALPSDAMGKITYIAPPGQYSLKVCFQISLFCNLDDHFHYVPMVELAICPKILWLGFFVGIEVGKCIFILC